jgi:8-oxo-dGTP pyrophosphatase MutT (NUDIX family)
MSISRDRPERFAGHRFPQVIPEPDHVAPGGPAPWASLPISQRTALSLERVVAGLVAVRQTLDDPVPAAPTELAVVADAWPEAVTRRSSVLVALFEEDGESHVVLTRRALSLRAHGGEIALPGGRSEEGETPVATALREAQEEVGLASATVRPVGWLSPLVTFASSSSIWPVVGILPERPELRANPREVERAFTVPLKDLVVDGAFLEERWRRGAARPGAEDDGFFPIYFFRVPGDLIWGATARVLTELLCVVTGATTRA